MAEDVWTEKITSLANERRKTLNKRGVRCVSVLICRRGQYPLFYTLMNQMGCGVKNKPFVISNRPLLSNWSLAAFRTTTSPHASESPSKFTYTMLSQEKISLIQVFHSSPCQAWSFAWNYEHRRVPHIRDRPSCHKHFGRTRGRSVLSTGTQIAIIYL